MSIPRMTEILELLNTYQTILSVNIPNIDLYTEDIPDILTLLEGAQEQLTGALTTISSDHAYIHQQKGFAIPYNTGSLAGDATYKAVLHTPATDKLVHLRPTNIHATSNSMILSIYEDSVNSGGTSKRIRNRYRDIAPEPADSTFKAGVTAALVGKNLMASTAGGNFGNQPAGDSIDVLSDNAADIGQIVTIYGTVTGATDTVTTEYLTLNGTDAVTSVITTWQNILGVELNVACAGTLTVRESSADATITSISTPNLSAGVATITDSRARDSILRHDADGASTKLVGIIGTDEDGIDISAVDALNGTTEEDHGALVFRTVTRILIGDVASATECWVLRPEVLLSQIAAGSGGVASTRSGGGNGENDEWVLEPDTDYVISVVNGPTTASTGYINFFFYEESM